MVAEQVMSEETNTKEHHHKKHHKKHHHHDKKPKGQSNIMTQVAAKTAAPIVKVAPASKSLLATKALNGNPLEAQSQTVDVPIDEVRAVTLKVSPTYINDHVESVTLKSFRKVVGYDTFNSILKKDRDEKKDISDYYNVTVSMMIKRVPEEVAAPPLRDPFDGSKTLSQSLDKGFPYDDGDNTTDDMTPNWSKGARPKASTLVGKLNGENITKDALVNLVRDTDAPITQGLLQLDEMKGDGDNLSTLFDHNVTRGALKNLITDKPSPITTALAQKGDSDNLSTLFDHNVTRGALKNLITDKPSPITTALAQIKDDKAQVFTLMDQNVTKGQMKNLITDKPSPITVALAQQKAKAAALAQSKSKDDKASVFTLMDQNVSKGAMKNLITDKPSPITVALAQKAKVAALAQAKAKGDGASVFTLMDQNVTKGAMKNLITDKPSPITVALGQKAKAAALAQAKTKGSDGASVFTLMDQNVTKGAMKNLITDKPSPITVALGQKKPAAKQMIQMEKTAQNKVVKRVQTKTGVKCFNKDDDAIDCTLEGLNVTIGALKNIVTDKPAPLTAPLTS